MGSNPIWGSDFSEPTFLLEYHVVEKRFQIINTPHFDIYCLSSLLGKTSIVPQWNNIHKRLTRKITVVNIALATILDDELLSSSPDSIALEFVFASHVETRHTVFKMVLRC